MGAILSINAADQLLQELDKPGYPQKGLFLVSSWLFPILNGCLPDTLVIIDRLAWGFISLAFLVLPYI